MIKFASYCVTVSFLSVCQRHLIRKRKLNCNAEYFNIIFYYNLGYFIFYFIININNNIIYNFMLIAAQHKKCPVWLLLGLLGLITVLARLGTYFNRISQTMHKVRMKANYGFSQGPLRWSSPGKNSSETTWQMGRIAPDRASQQSCRLYKSCPLMQGLLSTVPQHVLYLSSSPSPSRNWDYSLLDTCWVV